MSDTDDTDVLLLIPPDLFVVPSSSDTEDQKSSLRLGSQSRNLRHRHQRPRHHRPPVDGGVVTQIFEHVQSLETRISLIESRDNSFEASLLDASSDSPLLSRARQRDSSPNERSRRRPPCSISSRYSSLPNTPAKPHLRTASSKSSPGLCLPSSYIVANTRREAELQAERRESFDATNPTNASSPVARKRRELTNLAAPTKQAQPPARVQLERKYDVSANSAIRPSRECRGSGRNSDEFREPPRDAVDMELSEVDELLQEMEATEIELAKRIDCSNARRCADERSVNSMEGRDPTIVKSPMRRLDFQFADEIFRKPAAVSLNAGTTVGDSQPHADVSLPEDVTSSVRDTSVRISDFRVWESLENADRTRSEASVVRLDKPEDFTAGAKSTKLHAGRSPERAANRPDADPSYIGDILAAQSSKTFHTDDRAIKNNNASSFADLRNFDATKLRAQPEDDKSRVVDCAQDESTDSGLPGNVQSRCTDELQRTIREIRTIGHQGTSESLPKGSDACPRRTQRLLALSDFWDCDGTKSQEEMLRIKLEEEKFRREHCENLIQELQKRLLEQQEKVAVAIRVDNEKNAAISQFQDAWSKLRQRWETLEKEHTELESRLKSLTDCHNTEVAAYQQQIKRGESELSKALDLAAGYKEKGDHLVKEKLELLESHANELENYKSLVQEAEQRYQHLSDEYNRVLEKNKQLDEHVNQAQQELSKERSRSTEVRAEMAVIHKALDACEAELTILRQEKDNLQLKIKEETTRNGILEQNKIALVEAANEAKNREKAAKDEIKMLVERQEQIRSELREIYQNQLDEVVKAKLKEFQGQLDAAEFAFQADLETRQRAIAECAARKFKSIIDKHQLEINLLEEKHGEEKRLSEIQLAQASQKIAMLEMQLNAQRTGKTQLAEQLHSVMQKQWQQALHIISGGQMENLSPLQRLNAERIFEGKTSKRCNSACCNNKDRKSHRSELRSSSSQNLLNPNFRAQEHEESLVTLTSNDETPVSRKESKNDLRKYVKMILDMQQPNRDEFPRAKYHEESNPSPPAVTREVPRKHYTKKESNGLLSEESVVWQRAEDQSINDTSEYMQVPQAQVTQGTKIELPRNKPPWK